MTRLPQLLVLRSFQYNKKTFVIVLITILGVAMVKIFLKPAILSASLKKNFYEDCANKIIFQFLLYTMKLKLSQKKPLFTNILVVSGLYPKKIQQY